MTGWTLAGVAIVTAVAIAFINTFFRTWRRYHGVRVITCPDNQHAAAVSVDALRAAGWSSVGGETPVRLKACSRWPEMAGCGQECLAEIQASPEACLVQSIVTRWYTGKHCFYCRKDIGPIAWHERPPAVRTPDGVTREWKDVAAEELPEIFKTHQAVCWTCHVRESFRRDHQELVIERPHLAEVEPGLKPTASVY